MSTTSQSQSPRPFLSAGGARQEFETEQECADELLAALDQMRIHHDRNANALFEVAPEAISTAVRYIQESLKESEILPAAHAAGLSGAMAGEAISNFAAMLSPSATQTALAELRSKVRMEGAVAMPPRLVFHVLAGNLFLSGWESMMMASLTGACSIVRCSSADSEFPLIWQRAMAESDPLVKTSMAVGYWPTQWEYCTRIAAEAADVTVAFGEDSSVESVRALTPVRNRFIAHGSRFSIALLPGLSDDDALLKKQARGLAYDFTVYDQQGCLSPRALFVQSASRSRVRDFASILVAEMRALSRRLPRHKLTLEEAAELARERDEVRIQQATGGAACLLSSDVDPFVVTVRTARDWAPACANRFCDIRMFNEWRDLHEVLRPFRGMISTLGVQDSQPNKVQPLATALRIPRICSLGQMQKPRLGWIHDGGMMLADLMQWQEREQ